MKQDALRSPDQAQLDQTGYTKLFSTPMMQFKVPGSIVLNAELLLELEGMRGAAPGVEKSNRGGWHSKGNIFDHDAPCFTRLRDLARQAVYKMTRKVSSACDPDGLDLKLFGWMNANPTSGYNAPHTHPGAHWSGVYYVAQPEVEEGSGGMIEFLDPRSDLAHWRILEAAPFRSKRRLRPQPGEMILFPSYLVHWVHPNTSAQERVTLAFNATFRKTKKP